MASPRARVQPAVLESVATDLAAARRVLNFASEALMALSASLQGDFTRAQYLAEAMLKLARDPQLAQRMGDAAHTRGAIQNTWQDYSDRLLRKYEEAMG